jgi:fibronectin type 3 domain-containing protein
LTSRDDAGCPAAAVNVVPAIPTGWTSNVSPATLSLAPGASAIVTYDVTSAAASAAGTHSIGANVADNSGGHAASVAGNYAVDTRDTTPPSPPTGLVGSLRRGQVTLSWQPSTDNVAVTGYRVSRDGGVVALVTGTGWVDATVQSGATYTYSVAAYDSATNLSAASNVVSVKTGTAKKK